MTFVYPYGKWSDFLRRMGPWKSRLKNKWLNFKFDCDISLTHNLFRFFFKSQLYINYWEFPIIDSDACWTNANLTTFQISYTITYYVVGTIHQTFAHYTLCCISIVLKLHIIYVVWRSNPVGHNNWSIECLYPNSRGPVSSTALLTKVQIVILQNKF